VQDNERKIMQTPPPVSSDPLREAFRKEYPKLEAELSLGENNPDFRGLDDINARHAFARFSSGWSARATLTTIPSATEPDRNAARYLWLRDEGSLTWVPFRSQWQMSADKCDKAVDDEMDRAAIATRTATKD